MAVNIDDTMFNYMCKSYKGNSPSKKTDIIYIVDFYGHITNTYTCIL